MEYSEYMKKRRKDVKRLGVITRSATDNNKEPNTENFDSGQSIVRSKKDFQVKSFLVGEKEITSKLGVIGRFSLVSQDYTIALDDYIIGVDDTTLTRTLTLPSARYAGLGRSYILKDISGSAASTTIAVTPQTDELINGDTGSSINTNFGTLKLFSDGSNWFTF